MSHIASPNVVKPSRRSLAWFGIPDHRDALAIYFRWVRQRYYRAHAEMGPELASSMRSSTASHVEHQILAPPIGLPFDIARLTVDLLGVGAMCDDEAIDVAWEIEGLA